MCAQLLEELAQPYPVPSQSPTRKRQRFRQKAPEIDVKQEQEEEKALQMDDRTSVFRSYHYSSAVETRTRKQVDGLGAQKFPRRSQVHLLRHTIDLDIENSVFTVLHQFVEKLKLKPQMPEDVADVLRKCALERDVICRSDLNMSQDWFRGRIHSDHELDVKNCSRFCVVDIFLASHMAYSASCSKF